MRAAPRPSRRRARSRSARAARGGASGVGQARGGLGVGAREVLDAERLAGRAALGAPLVVAAGGVLVLRARVERDEPPVAEVERDRRRASSVAKSIRSACAGSAHSAASWSSRPVSRADPVVLHARAELGELDAVGLGARPPARSARGQRRLERRRGREPGALRDVAGERAAARRGRRRRAARSSAAVAAHEGAPAVARRAGRRRRGERVASRRGRAPRAWISVARRARSASTVTPRSIANGSARPPL